MKMCEYESIDEVKCLKETLPNSRYCILHIDFPENEESEEFKRIAKLKEKKIREKISSGDFNFEGARLMEVELKEVDEQIKGNVNFSDTIIRKGVFFDQIDLQESLSFDRAKINGSIDLVYLWTHGSVSFAGADVGGRVYCEDSKIDGIVLFDDAKINKYISFENAQIGGAFSLKGANVNEELMLSGAEIGGDFIAEGVKVHSNIWFEEAKIGGNILLDAAEIWGNISLNDADFTGRVTALDAKINRPECKEEIFRRAKMSPEISGNREIADYYFYHEMEAKRKQKGWIIRLLEIPIQYIFGYGTRPYNVLSTWFLVVFGFAFLFWIGEGVENAKSLWECIYFSVVTATTLGYGDYHPTHGIYQALAGFEAIFGTFMWAAFIVIFARKYMR